MLRKVLAEDVYINFLTLHVALCILFSKQLNTFSNYANELLQHFVSNFARIYGEEHISHNVHCLLHLSEDVEKMEPWMYLVLSNMKILCIN